MPKLRLKMERMRAWYQTQCISKFIQPGTADSFVHLFRRSIFTSCFLISFCSNIRKKIAPYVMSFGFRWVCFGMMIISLPGSVWWCWSLSVYSSSIFGVILILVDFVLVIVDISLQTRSREVGDALEAVSLLISFFFLADVLLRVYVEGWVRKDMPLHAVATSKSYLLWSLC